MEQWAFLKYFGAAVGMITYPRSAMHICSFQNSYTKLKRVEVNRDLLIIMSIYVYFGIAYF